MKPFLAYLLVPALGLGGWAVTLGLPASAPVILPNVPALAAPPALGVVIAPQGDRSAKRVRLDALLPPASRKLADGAPAVAPTLPKVSAVLIDGNRRVAQVDGKAVVAGDHQGYFRVVAIESGRVLFEHPALRDKRWVSVTER